MPAGRPSKFRPEYCQAIIDFFSVQPYEEKEVTVKYKNGDERTEVKEVPNDLPLFSMFAMSIKTSHVTILAWCKEFPEFLKAYEDSKALQERFLMVNTLRGNYEQPFAIFTAKNILGWRDTQDIRHSGYIENSEEKDAIKKEVADFMAQVGVK